LSAIPWADEIFVVDSASTDGTQRIAEEFGATLVQFEFNGTWPKKKNWALEHLPFQNEWVFVLDADEVLPRTAEVEFAEVLRSGAAENIVGYWINRRFMFMGRWLRHAYYPNWNLRLFKHAGGRYEKLTGSDTRSGDNEVHEHVVVEGATRFLKTEIDHYAFPSVEVFIEKHNRYSNWEAQVAMDGYLSASERHLQRADVGWRRRLKRWSHSVPGRPWLRFFYVYVWQLGILDGKRGFYFACLHGVYELLCVTKTAEARMSAIDERAPAARG
jgi:glycosyltransferase involved in cell wall biosynthesis